MCMIQLYVVQSRTILFYSILLFSFVLCTITKAREKEMASDNSKSI